MRPPLSVLFLCTAVSLTACHRSPNAKPPVPVPTPAATPTPQPSPRPTPTPSTDLSGYVGKYPFDRVAGRTFLQAPAVVAAVRAAVPDVAVRRAVLSADGPQTPIARDRGRLVAWGCETHNCGDHDWAILIAADGGDGAVCYHDAATMGETARWYRAGAAPSLRAGDCPSGG